MGDNDFATGYAIGQSDSKGNGGGNGMWGDQGWWVIIIFALLFGWGGNGWGGNNNGGGGAVPYLSGVATRSDVMDGFALNDLQRGVSGIQQGICDSTYALNNAITNGFNSTNMALCQGFNGVERQAANIGFQLQDCCCQTQRAIDGVNYNMATNFCAVQNTANNNTRDIIQSTHNDTDRIISRLNQMEEMCIRDSDFSLVGLVCGGPWHAGTRAGANTVCLQFCVWELREYIGMRCACNGL